ncbi:hypothetical protein [Mesorhizobium sp. B2-8-5]|uniref:hypothetical protein n=1 Tax=Mesorhizobium sp. B2-8-5 TaxID=2589903 RepID=UPI00112E0AE5|nr:hypothetical protein [Mesorhizobium sp. B2-8-5]UCI25814.1 hypothetical protein FJ430_30400 [Mesorhizobium sp. B2-8-5]
MEQLGSKVFLEEYCDGFSAVDGKFDSVFWPDWDPASPSPNVELEQATAFGVAGHWAEWRQLGALLTGRNRAVSGPSGIGFVPQKAAVQRPTPAVQTLFTPEQLLAQADIRKAWIDGGNESLP